MGEVRLQFLGATQTVTGSRFLLSSDTSRVLIDVGLFQGTADVRRRNWEEFPVDPKSIDAVVLTHAHLDHCGYLPLLVRQGFDGPVFCTTNTGKLAEIILRDSGRLQEEDAFYARRKGFSKHKVPLPLYTEQDAIEALSHFQTIDFHTPHPVTSEVTVTFHPSGHILGSAFLTCEVLRKRVLFTGDLGRSQHPILVPPDPIPTQKFDAVITESTYGDRIHETPTQIFAEAIRSTIARGGSVLIPAFAVDRTEMLLVELRDLLDKGEIPEVPIYVDSPMALASLQLYRKAVQNAEPDIRADVAAQWHSRDPFDSSWLHEMQTVEASKSLKDVKPGHIIVSASGMATGGRVVHHLARMLPNSNNAVVLVGFQAAGTRGRLLEQGDTAVKIHGQWVPVRAQIIKAEKFSAHADGDELVSWLSGGREPACTFVVHGETGASQAFAQHIEDALGWPVVVPANGQVFVL